MRFLRHFGSLAVKLGGSWTVSVKPQRPGTDQWEQHYHGADNNAVAQDSVVGPPRRYQWLGEPEWQRSHLAMPSINSMVSTGGRLFTVEDRASAEHPALPGVEGADGLQHDLRSLLGRSHGKARDVVFEGPVFLRKACEPIAFPRGLLFLE